MEKGREHFRQDERLTNTTAKIHTSDDSIMYLPASMSFMVLSVLFSDGESGIEDGDEFWKPEGCCLDVRIKPKGWEGGKDARRWKEREGEDVGVAKE